MSQAPFPQLVNFTAGNRKPYLIPTNYFSPGDNISWIYSIASGVSVTPVALVGTIDGTNAVFTVPGTILGGVAIFRNGVLLTLTTHYTISGNTITFNASNIPQVGDDLECLVS